MADCIRRVLTRTTIQFVVPVPCGFGACWDEVMRAIRAAHQELWDSGMVSQGEDAPADFIRFQVADDEIIVFYEQSELNSGY